MVKTIELNTFDLSKVITPKTFFDNRGHLTVLDKDVLPFEIKRIYYIYNAVGVRGSHRHKKTRQAIICLAGKFDLVVNDGKTMRVVTLDDPTKCILLEPEDWHQMKNFSKDAVILVLASEHYDPDDYIDEEYKSVIK